MSIFIRLWLVIATVLVAGAWLTVDLLRDEVKPSVRQSIEDTLADNAHLVAALVADDLKNHRLGSVEFDRKIRDWMSRSLQGRIWDIPKRAVSQQLYITDANGIVLYDSRGLAAGQDYSRWNDVWLTLRGRYGVRSSRSDPQDESSSVMYVAAPVRDGSQLIGVVTLAKPGVAMEPFIARAQARMLRQGAWVVALALLLSALGAWWLRQGINRVGQYALDMSSGRKPPHFLAARELNQLVAAIDRMREELEGKAYVERLVHTLTHEIKSPLTAVRASAELLREDLPPEDRERFCQNIDQQADRLHHLAEQLLLLARLEKGNPPAPLQSLALPALVKRVLEQRQVQLQAAGIQVRLETQAGDLRLNGDEFWLTQAIGNIIDNAIDFMPDSAILHIRLDSTPDRVELHVRNPGPAIPDYALTQVFDRFYTLPRPDGRRAGAGIGLTLVREVMTQHRGEVRLLNVAGGVEAILSWPR